MNIEIVQFLEELIAGPSRDCGCSPICRCDSDINKAAFLDYMQEEAEQLLNKYDK